MVHFNVHQSLNEQRQMALSTRKAQEKHSHTHEYNCVDIVRVVSQRMQRNYEMVDVWCKGERNIHVQPGLLTNGFRIVQAPTLAEVLLVKGLPSHGTECSLEKLG